MTGHEKPRLVLHTCAAERRVIPQASTLPLSLHKLIQPMRIAPERVMSPPKVRPTSSAPAAGLIRESASLPAHQKSLEPTISLRSRDENFIRGQWLARSKLAVSIMSRRSPTDQERASEPQGASTRVLLDDF
jgi:hypothetical protein